MRAIDAVSQLIELETTETEHGLGAAGSGVADTGAAGRRAG